MSHDPLCVLSDCHPNAPTYCRECERSCICDRLAKARADEREQAAQRVAELGCHEFCGCSITIPNAAAAARGEEA